MAMLVSVAVVLGRSRWGTALASLQPTTERHQGCSGCVGDWRTLSWEEPHLSLGHAGVGPVWKGL